MPIANTSVQQPSVAPDDHSIASRADEALDRALAEQRVVGAVVIIARDGRVVYQRAAGRCPSTCSVR